MLRLRGECQQMRSQTSDSLPITEQDNPRTTQLSSLPVEEIVRLMNQEDTLVAGAVTCVLPQIVKAVEEIFNRLSAGGRLFYVGTGTSGRLGVLDASECPPTFGVSPDLVQAVIAGGYEACYRAVEASEDDTEAGAHDLQARGFSSQDVAVGIAASGRTPYTVGALSYARSLGALCVAVTCAPDTPITRAAEISIVPLVGPEVVTGSTRLKAGTAQKMVLNILSTATMVKLGYVKGNRMTNLLPRNVKLRERSVRIFSAEADVDEESALAALERGGGDLRTALVMHKTNRSREEAVEALKDSRGVVEQAIKILRGEHSIQNREQ
jgi:N-acetylmuramic acid 6-phosphate etherase